MALVSDNLKSCGVKICASVGGVPSFGSGIIYVTPNFLEYNYVLTAKHIFQEDSQTTFDHNDLSSIEILYCQDTDFKRLQYIKKAEVRSALIIFPQDFAIILIKKNDNIHFSSIIVSDKIEDDDDSFFSWATFSANQDQLHKFDFTRNDFSVKRFKMSGNLSYKYLSGMSGAGVFHSDRSTLIGIICSYPNEEFQNETIDCTIISFSDINNFLRRNGKVELDCGSSTHKRQVGNEVVDIHQAIINNVSLDLELARKRLKTDLQDDWYYDPLQYIDLLNQDYIFEQFREYFGNENYKASVAEHFYIPKKKLTLRQSLLSPFIDRLMYLAAVGVLAEKLDGAMIPYVFSARYNKYSSDSLIINGVEQWKKMKYKMDEFSKQMNPNGTYTYGCIIEIDLLNFYDNINKKLLFDKILRVCETVNENNAAILIYKILCSLSKKELGLPQNSDASALLASFYLNQVDAFMQHNTPTYFRFMDDIRIFCKDKYEARKILQTFEFELRRCHLSVNSQKTEIFDLDDNRAKRAEYSRLFDVDLRKIQKFRSSENYAYRNEAFHLSIAMSQENITEDINGSEDSSRKLNFALSSLALLVKKDINLYNIDSRFEKTLKLAVASLKDRPWMTTQICKILNLLSQEVIEEHYLVLLKEIVLDRKFNTYTFQTYQIWLLLAKHKCNDSDLKRFAVLQIERNDETNRPAIAAMIIYMCSIESGYRRVTLRKFGEDFARGYFQNRIALICLRSFSSEIVDKRYVNPTLKYAHEFLHKFKNKQLIYIHGFNEHEEENEAYEQMYSI